MPLVTVSRCTSDADLLDELRQQPDAAGNSSGNPPTALGRFPNRRCPHTGYNTGHDFSGVSLDSNAEAPDSIVEAQEAVSPNRSTPGAVPARRRFTARNHADLGLIHDGQATFDGASSRSVSRPDSRRR
jgi:hypothetical protein